MHILIAIIFLSAGAFAKDFRENKRGVSLGIGGGFASYKFPVQFTGTSKNKIDDSATVFGPSLNIGYDFLLSSRILLGIRTEGMILDTLNTGATDTKKVKDKTTGKISAGTVSLRAGYLFDFDSWNPVGDRNHLIGEFFLEGGMTSGHKSFSKNYSTTDRVIENYHENLEESYQGRVLSGGVNLTNLKGAFFEFKLLYTSIQNNKQNFSGTQLTGGSTTPTDQKLENENKKGFTSLLITVGHHY